MAETIDSVLKFISLIGFLLIGSGLLKLMVYYKAFKLRIFPFLDLKEIILSFTDNLFAYFFILMLAFLTGYIFYNNLESYGFTFEMLKKMSLLERSLIYLDSNWNIITIIMLLSIVAILVWKFRENIFGYEAIVIIIVLWISLFITPIIISELSQIKFTKAQQPLDINYLMLIMGVIALISYVIGSAFNEIHKVKKYNYFEGSEFIIGEEKIRSTKKYYYVGQSRKYIFFYDSESDHSEVYPIDKVSKFKFVR